MSKREHIKEDDWLLIVDCPFNGNNINLANLSSLTGGTTFTSDPVDSSRQVAYFTADSHRRYVPLSVFTKDDTGRCKIELDFLFYNHSTPTNPNIIDNSSSGNGGIYTQKEGVWKLAITNRAWNVTQTPTFAEQRLNIDVSNFTINNWYHLHIIRIPDLLEVEVTDSNNIQIGYLRNTQVGVFNASLNGSWMKNLTIGGSSAYTPRYLNGCIKNLKIYRHKNY